MCHGRLALGQTPACVAACPEGAIEIELVEVAGWRADVAAATAPGVPVMDHSVSTTRVSLPDGLPPNTRPRDITHVVPEHAQWSLILMTVLTQLSVGAFGAIWSLQILGESASLGIAALISLGVGSLALGAATLHLGRPVYAYRALRMWRRSWLSREVLLFSGFSAVAGAYAGALWFRIPGGAGIGAATALLGLAGVTASGFIYLVPSRPSWNTSYTIAEFILTAGILGPLFGLAVAAGDSKWLGLTAAAMAAAQFVVMALRFKAGANRLQVVFRVILPYLYPAWLIGFGMAFARAIGEYGSVVFIAGNMPMKTEIASLLIITKLTQYDYVGAAAIAFVLLILSFTLLLALNALQGWSARRLGYKNVD